jgi:4-amino-4-deoxy-L-arabinose transferase-like glycosyltransferase
MGFAWWLRGGTADTLSGDWDWGADWNYNVTTGRYPSPDLLIATRLPSALLLAAGVPLMFALGWLLGGRPAAWATAILFAVHPVLLLNGRRAMMEGSLIFFSLLTVCAALWFSRRRSWASALGLGVAGALTIASKHTGAAVVAAVFAGLGVCLGVEVILRWTNGRDSLQAGKVRDAPTGDPALVWTRRASPVLHDALKLLAAALLVLLVFFALNPAWWGGDPIEVGRTILAWRQELITAQAADHQGYRDTTTQLLGFAQMSFGGDPQYFEVTGWGEVPQIGDQIAAYETSPWGGLRWSSLAAAALLVLSMVGLFALLRDPKPMLAERLILLLWAGVSILITFLSPLAWQRYYLPIYPPMLLLAVYAPFGMRRVWNMWRAERKEKGMRQGVMR